MSAKVRIATSAEYDLESIADYIGLDSPPNAANFVREILAQCYRLAEFPGRHPVVEGYSRPLRRCPFRGYSIYYLASGGLIQVVHVLNDSRDHRDILAH